MAVDKTTPVLVVDDYGAMVRIVRNLLVQLGFDDIDDASDGAAALTKLHTKTYGLVISDWMMEPMSGLELLAQVRADSRLQTLPFIMITAERGAGRVAEVERAGADAYIVKPLDAHMLRDKIAAVLG